MLVCDYHLASRLIEGELAKQDLVVDKMIAEALVKILLIERDESCHPISTHTLSSYIGGMSNVWTNW